MVKSQEAVAAKEESKKTQLTISPPNFQTATFQLVGTAPLVIHRFSSKIQKELEEKQEEGKSSSSKKKRKPKSSEDSYNEARYISKEGWDGFNASSIRNAMISSCRLVSYKMTTAKMSVFVVADGCDAIESQIPLVRIIGKPVMQQDMARTATGSVYVTVRPAYHNWRAKVQIRWDADQFQLADVANLLSRAGQQVGIGEGRPDSKNSAGMGWGTFELAH